MPGGSQLYPGGNGKRLKGVNQKSAEVRTGWGSLGSGEEGSAENVTMAVGGGAGDALAGTVEGTY